MVLMKMVVFWVLIFSISSGGCDQWLLHPVLCGKAHCFVNAFFLYLSLFTVKQHLYLAKDLPIFY